MKNKAKNRSVIQKDGVTYVIESQGKDGNIISRWLSKPVYVALMESGLYSNFMGTDNLKEASDILAQKKSSIKKRRF